MRKRRLWLGLIAVFVLAAGFVVLFRGEREPEYGGKRLSEWVKVLPSSWDARQDPDVKEAEEAIRQIGTNALPYLMNWISYEPAAWKAICLGVANIVFRGALHDQRGDRASCAVHAIEVLETKAAAAVPALAVMVNDPKARNTGARAATLLSWLAQVLLAADMALMTNHSDETRCIGIVSARHFGAPAVPAVIQCFGDTNETVVVVAMYVLSELRLEPTLVVPALIEKLEDERVGVRKAAIGGLAEFRAQACTAIPALRALLKDADPEMRQIAFYALDQLDPEALEQVNAQ